MSGATKLDSAAQHDTAMGGVVSLIDRLAAQLEMTRPEALDLISDAVNAMRLPTTYETARLSSK